ncbi:MAG: glycosyltransferase [Lachnospiraceae bacterium]|nr:glycosyltransferase [Lachnospiraceae bacterium]MBR6486344.1 glycosyltransferase [Lachnospiraceae bacterium]
MKNDFQMIDVQKEYEQDLLDAQIIRERQEELYKQAYLKQQEEYMRQLEMQQAMNDEILRENAKQFAAQMPSTWDVTAVSLHGNMDNTFAGNAIPVDPIVPRQVYDSHMTQMATAMNVLSGRKVLLVNTVCGTGSVGRLTVGLYRTLEDYGYECLAAYGRGEAPEGIRGYRIGTDMDMYIHGAMSRLYDRHGFYSMKATQDFVAMVKEYDPDIIHLHNVHGYYLNLGVLFSYLKKCGKKIIWTLHDCWSFTGHCSHFEYIGCQKWLTGCFKCEQLHEYPKSFGVDSSSRNYEAKKQLFTGIENLTIVTPSEWLKDKVQQSFLKEYPVTVVPTGIDLTQFYPREEIMSEDNLIYRVKNHLSLRNKTILLGVANPWRDRKGLVQFEALAKTLDERYAIILVGLNEKQIKALPENIIGLSRTDSTEELACLYSMADIYINLTLEDTFPTTNIEALACGTPVITYKAGGSPESIDETCGEAVDRNSIQGIVAAIDKIQSLKGECYTTQMCLRRAQLYSKEYRFLEYIQNVYEAL